MPVTAARPGRAAGAVRSFYRAAGDRRTGAAAVGVAALVAVASAAAVPAAAGRPAAAELRGAGDAPPASECRWPVGAVARFAGRVRARFSAVDRPGGRSGERPLA